MKKNMSGTDRIIRMIAAIVIAVLYFTHTIRGTLGMLLLVVAGVFVLTSLVGLCPLYSLIGLKTCSTENK